VKVEDTSEGKRIKILKQKLMNIELTIRTGTQRFVLGRK